ncbi:LamG domain-containing protein, partial [candidate division KSB1 bacterium]|nr:LamG domain-containing protein [candidate division KSB1 bacterium]
IDENTWYHAVIIVDSRFTKAYVNGQYVNSVQFVNHHSINGFPNAFIGTSRNIDTYFFGGSIDDIRIYNYTLSHEEVQTLFKEQL